MRALSRCLMCVVVLSLSVSATWCLVSVSCCCRDSTRLLWLVAQEPLPSWPPTSPSTSSESLDSVNPSIVTGYGRAHWLRGRASDSQLRGPGFESCAAVLKPWASLFTLHCSSSLSCINEYLVIDSGGYVYKQPSIINCSIWLDASQRSWEGVWLNRSVREVKSKALRAILRIRCCAI